METNFSVHLIKGRPSLAMLSGMQVRILHREHTHQSERGRADGQAVKGVHPFAAFRVLVVTAVYEREGAPQSAAKSKRGLFNPLMF